MPKLLVLSNGNLHIGLDDHAQVHDLYFPYVGLENQTGGHYHHRLGVWIDNQFSWFDEPGWVFTVDYQPDTMAGLTVAHHDQLQIRLNFTDLVYNEKDIFLRRLEVTNLADHPRLIKVFFHHQLEIHESHLKDTAYYDPAHNLMVHYKGRRAFAMSAQIAGRFFDDFTTGLFYIEGREGSHIDALDGTLNKNPIEHGQVDSIISLSATLDPQATQTAFYWLTASTTVQGAYALHDYVQAKSPAYLIKTTTDYWHAWITRQSWDFSGLSDSIASLFKKSLFIMRSHTDNRGGIIASCDSDLLKYGRDTYSYIWPRDGAISALALTMAGDEDTAGRFFMFCNSVLHPDGYFLHKYRPDLALGSSWHPWIRDGHPQLPIQEDETALVLISLWSHYRLTRDLEFIESIYNSLIKVPAEFMVAYRDPATGLPQPSYNLWEEKYGVATYTSATVFGALTSAANFADLLGKSDSAARYRTAASGVKEGILKHLYDPDQGYFYRQIQVGGQPEAKDLALDMSSAYGVFRYGVLPVDDERLTRAMSLSLYKLGLTTLVGGIARYDGDPYFRVDWNLPGNPWFITTLWLAQYYLAQAKKPDDLASVRRLLDWVALHARSSGILSEQLNPHTGEQISAAPLTWSHAEFVITVLEYIAKLDSM